MKRKTATLQFELLNRQLRQAGWPPQKACTFIGNWYASELKQFKHADLVTLRFNVKLSKKESTDKKHTAMCTTVLSRIEKLLVDMAIKENYGITSKKKGSKLRAGASKEVETHLP